jgi:hypothetical protein
MAQKRMPAKPRPAKLGVCGTGCRPKRCPRGLTSDISAGLRVAALAPRGHLRKLLKFLCRSVPRQTSRWTRQRRQAQSPIETLLPFFEAVQWSWPSRTLLERPKDTPAGRCRVTHQGPHSSSDWSERNYRSLKTRKTGSCSWPGRSSPLRTCFWVRFNLTICFGPATITA